MKKLIIFLVRRRLGLKEGERFRFDNQKSPTDYYYFDKTTVMKMETSSEQSAARPSRVSLNWLLNDDCKITKI